MTLSLSNAMGKQTPSLVVETFHWRHVMMTAVECYGGMHRLITFVRHVVCILNTKRSKIMHRTVVKIVNIKKWISFFLRFIEEWTQWVPCKVNVVPFGHHLLCTGPVVFILRWTSEKSFVALAIQLAHTCILVRGYNYVTGYGHTIFHSRCQRIHL